jgi:NTE family protein
MNDMKVGPQVAEHKALGTQDVADRVLRGALAEAFGCDGSPLDQTSLRVVVAEAGHLICDVGDLAQTAWVVVAGRVQSSTAESDGEEHVLAIHGPGELIGEAAFLEEGQRRARMRALRKTLLAEMDRPWLLGLLATHPEAATAVVTAILQRTDRRVGSPTGVIAVVPLDSTVVDESKMLCDAIASISNHIVVGPDASEGSVAELGSGQFDWLDEAERTNGGVVLLGDPARPEWTLAAAEVADRVVFVADAEAGPQISDGEHRILQSVPRGANSTRFLILVHQANTERPHRTRDWLELRDVDRHLHLRRRTPADRFRVARHLIGRPLTLAIGAGGVRSAGAVGTIRALARSGVAVDAVAGVSGGSIIASWLAVEPNIDRLGERTEWSMRKLLDYTIPVGAVIAGRRVWRRLQESVQDRDITDSWLPLAIVSTDLTDGVPVNHLTGAMADAVYASISIPGIFPPVDIDGHLHVDGAIFDAIPVEAGRTLVPEGQMVVVDLAPPHGRSTPPLPRVMSGPRLLARRLIPGMRTSRVPNPLDTLMRSTTVASARRRADALESIDCHVHLDLSEFNVLEFDKVRQIIAAGEAQSVGPLDDYLASDDAPLKDPVLLELNGSSPRSNERRQP